MEQRTRSKLAFFVISLCLLAGAVVVIWFKPWQRSTTPAGDPGNPFAVPELYRDFKTELDGRRVVVNGRLKAKYWTNFSIPWDEVLKDLKTAGNRSELFEGLRLKKGDSIGHTIVMRLI